MDTRQAIPLYQTFLHVFSFRKLHLSETGHSTLVTPNPGESSSQASSEVGAPSQPSLLGLLPLLSSKKSICCQTVKKQNQDWLHLTLTTTWHPGSGCLVFAPTSTLQLRVRVSFFSVIFILQFKSSWRRKQSAGVCFLPWAQATKCLRQGLQCQAEPKHSPSGHGTALRSCERHKRGPPPLHRAHCIPSSWKTTGEACPEPKAAPQLGKAAGCAGGKQTQLSARAWLTAAQLHLLIITSLAPRMCTFFHSY